MESMKGILERKDMPEQLTVPLNTDMRIMKDNQNCQKETLVSTLEGDVTLCRCGIYHVQINNTALYLSEAQFNATARLFKLAFGILAGRRLYPESVYAASMGVERAVSTR